MSVSIAVTNLGSRAFSMPGFGTMAAAPAVTKTKVIKQVRADDISKNFDNLGKFGVVIAENGTARPGSVVITTTATLLAAQKAVLVDMTASFTLTLAVLSGFAVGDTICIFLRSRVAGTLTIDGSGAETVNGAATATLTAAGQVLRIEKASTTNWVTATV